MRMKRAPEGTADKLVHRGVADCYIFGLMGIAGADKQPNKMFEDGASFFAL